MAEKSATAAGGEEKAETEDDEDAVDNNAGVVDIDYCSYEDGNHCAGNEVCHVMPFALCMDITY